MDDSPRLCLDCYGEIDDDRPAFKRCGQLRVLCHDCRLIRLKAAGERRNVKRRNQRRELRESGEGLIEIGKAARDVLKAIFATYGNVYDGGFPDRFNAVERKLSRSK